MDAHRKHWNEQQRILQQALHHPADYPKAIDLFLSQHAMLHAAEMSGSGLWSFEDEIWQGLSEADARSIPPNMEHSIAWVMWHIARIEDITMNLLVAGSPQVLHQDHWLERLCAPIQHSGNAMDEQSIVKLSKAVNLATLCAYRAAVGRRTRDIVQALQAKELKQKVEASRIQRVRDEGAVVEAASEIVDYWGKRTVAGLLLMPATRHNVLHLNEAERIKQKNRLRTKADKSA
jgi:hypothetical protein